MQNEFYEVTFDIGRRRVFFREKDKAFAFLWQEFLNNFGDMQNEFIQEAFNEMNEFYMIEGFGYVNVCGFEIFED